ncbi:MAG: ABC transporter permease [Rhodospirillales bacterium]
MIQQPRVIGYINWLGLWTLYLKEVRRFTSVYTQTLMAPVVTTLLFLTIFWLALGGAVREVNGVPFLSFLAPGLVMMAIAQNAFANTSSSFVISKIQGNIVDVLMPPIGAGELLTGFALGGMTRGVCVGAVVMLAMMFVAPIGIDNIFLVLFHAFAASLLLSLLGILGGIWADKFDHIAAVTNFVITPLSFLSGTFYSINRLPETFQTIAHFNPFFYMIDGFRAGFIGQADTNPLLGVAVMACVDLALWMLLLRMLRSGYKLKA